MYFDGVVLDEYADMNPEIWSKVIRPALSDRQGWAIFIGTPKGQNHFYEIYQFSKNGKPEEGIAPPEDWYSALYKASETGIIDRAELDAARATMADSEYEQEYECSFAAALIGAYYGKEMEKAESDKRITSVPYDPILPVTTAWDLGMDDTTSIWFFQLHGREVRVIDYLENSGSGLDYYVRELMQQRDYRYEEHILPHDAQVRELGTGVSRLETLRSMGLKNVTVAPKLSVEDGINASRLMLAKCVFDAAKCKRGIDSLKNYERRWDSRNKIFQQRPLHNWASHGADAFRTGAVGLDTNRPSEDQRRKLPRSSLTDYSVV
jgi:hypothetical protein